MIKKEIRATIARKIKSIRKFFMNLTFNLYHDFKKFFYYLYLILINKS